MTLMEKEVEKVNPERECERNAGNGGVLLWLRNRRWEGEMFCRQRTGQNTVLIQSLLLPSLLL